MTTTWSANMGTSNLTAAVAAVVGESGGGGGGGKEPGKC